MLPALLVFARTPQPGRTKTRLQPPCTPQQAADLAAAFIEETVETACDAWPGPVRLLVWPQVDHPLFHQLARSRRIPVVRQCAGDLGEKMSSAIMEFTDTGTPVAILGSDVPHCPASTLATAAARLDAGKNVIGPSEDGGYYLIGLTASHPVLFRDIPWGTSKVLASTCERAFSIGIELELLPQLDDLDTWERVLAVEEKLLPRLQAMIRAIGAGS